MKPAGSSGASSDQITEILVSALQKVVLHAFILHMQVPMAATVYCQPIQMRTERVLGFDMAAANQWRWRPDYEGLDLNHMRQASFHAHHTPAFYQKGLYICTFGCDLLSILKARDPHYDPVC